MELRGWCSWPLAAAMLHCSLAPLLPNATAACECHHGAAPFDAPPACLQVRVKELEGALREYKKENGRFFEMKERYKAAIAGLEREVEVRGWGVPQALCGAGPARSETGVAGQPWPLWGGGGWLDVGDAAPSRAEGAADGAHAQREALVRIDPFLISSSGISGHPLHRLLWHAYAGTVCKAGLAVATCSRNAHYAAPLQAKEREKQELLGMCNELMTRLEREGLAT